MKHISLVILTVQNSALVLTMRYSRILAGPRYLTSTAVVLSEALKCVICVIVHLHQQRFPSEHIQLPLVSADSRPSRRYGLHQLLEDLFGQKSGFIKLLVPAVLYTLQNNLQFIAASNLDAATFQVTYQCKILTTAVFAVALLRQSLSLRKWMSLVILTIGVAFVQIPSSSTVTDTGHRFLGLMAVAVACLLSGLAGVYFEKILKGTSASIWLRNIQLGFASMAIAVVGAVAWDGPVIRADGFFHGYNLVVVSTILIQAMGGLVVAMVIKHADNILKVGISSALGPSDHIFVVILTQTAGRVLRLQCQSSSPRLYRSSSSILSLLFSSSWDPLSSC